AVLNTFLNRQCNAENIGELLNDYCSLDDYDVFFSIKEWANHEDKILALLSKSLVNRKLLKVKYFTHPVPADLVAQKINIAKEYLRISEEETSYLLFTGNSEINTYNHEVEHINILFKNGTVKDISEVDNALINQSLSGTIKKFYICFINLDLS